MTLPLDDLLATRVGRSAVRARWAVFRDQVLAQLPAPARLLYRARWLPRYTRTTPPM